MLRAFRITVLNNMVEFVAHTSWTLVLNVYEMILFAVNNSNILAFRKKCKVKGLLHATLSPFG